jgi:hypothetical protein
MGIHDIEDGADFLGTLPANDYFLRESNCGTVEHLTADNASA